MRQKFFGTPTQVMFRDPHDETQYLFGIAYHDIIICGCCGGTFEIEEICEINADDDQPFYIAGQWKDMTYYLERNDYKGYDY